MNTPHDFENSFLATVTTPLEGFYALAASVVIQAKKDYEMAFSDYVQEKDGKHKTEIRTALRHLCNFFYSKNAEILCAGKSIEVFDLLVSNCQLKYGYLPDSVCAHRRFDNYNNFAFTH